MDNLFKYIHINPKNWKEYIDLKEERKTIDKLEKSYFNWSSLGIKRICQKIIEKIWKKINCITSRQAKEKQKSKMSAVPIVLYCFVLFCIVLLFIIIYY